MPQMLSLSVIMPALNEEDNVGAAITDTLQAFDSLGVTGELIVVNDGSSDSTQTVIDSYISSDKRVKVVRHDKPMGIGRSFWDGKSLAMHEAVVMYPGDNEMIASDMMKYLHLLQQTDIVIPFIVNTSVRSATRQYLSKVYLFIVATLLQIRVSYTNGLILYRKSVIDQVHLQTDGFMFQTEILAKLIRDGYLFAEVPFFIKPRLAGKSKASSLASLKGIVSLFIQLISLIKKVYSTPREKVIPNSATFNRWEELQKQSQTVNVQK